MRYREIRFPCRIQTRFVVNGVSHPGVVLNVSRGGILAELGTRVRVGNPVYVSIAGKDREATVARLDGSRTGILFDRPLTPGELRSLRTHSQTAPRGSRFLSEM
ncbi:MAG: PilZ domain-containing protein [Pseudomonadota bacterium]